MSKELSFWIWTVISIQRVYQVCFYAYNICITYVYNLKYVYIYILSIHRSWDVLSTNCSLGYCRIAQQELGRTCGDSGHRKDDLVTSQNQCAWKAPKIMCLFWGDMNTNVERHKWLSGWWFQPLWKTLVSWDDDIPNVRKMKDVPNHQPVTNARVLFCSLNILQDA